MIELVRGVPPAWDQRHKKGPQQISQAEILE
jgi:hypothetical protein